MKRRDLLKFTALFGGMTAITSDLIAKESGQLNDGEKLLFCSHPGCDVIDRKEFMEIRDGKAYHKRHLKHHNDKGILKN